MDASTGRVVVENLDIADRPWSRLLGWQFRRRPPKGVGLLIVPCRSVHTCFVRFSLDVLGLDRQGRVVAARRGLRPWRVACFPRDVHAVLELPAGSTMELKPGDRLQIEAASADREGSLRRSLRFLQSAEFGQETQQ